MQQIKVIFACVHNAGRSQMAAALFNQLADSAKANQAGTAQESRRHYVDCGKIVAIWWQKFGSKNPIGTRL
jgi:protein-tyrosine-phosphatase